MENDSTVLRQIPAFAGLTIDTLQFLFERAQTRRVPAGECFFEQGEIGDSVYILEVGEVVVEKNIGSKRYQLRKLGSGDCFGEMALLAVMARTASVRAITDCDALQITNRQLRQLYAHDLEQFTMLVMNLGREVCRRLAELDRRLSEFQAAAMDEPVADAPGSVDPGATLGEPRAPRSD